MKFKEWIEGEKICIIMRGIPGSGKSYKVNQLLAKYGGDTDHVFSADKYFERLGDSEFTKRYGRSPTPEESKEAYKQVRKPFRLGAAHKDCFQQFKAAVDLGITPVIVDNTNTKRWQFEKHFKYASDQGYKVRIEEPESPWWKAAEKEIGFNKIKRSPELQALHAELVKRQTHGVPSDKLAELIDDTWERMPKSMVGKFVDYDKVFADKKGKKR